MIKDQAVVSRYAEAFLSVAKLNCGIDKVLEDIVVVKNIIRENPGFNQLMDNPEISFAEKSMVIDGVVKNGINDEMRNFLKLLLDKKRFNIFLDVAEYLRVKYGHQGQVDVLLKTAFPLELDLRKKLNQNLRFYIDLDGSLLGGVQVVIGNKIIDGSVKKRLEGLHDRLTTVRMG
jgi:F-type H+-transporting ATPase subunit delta